MKYQGFFFGIFLGSRGPTGLDKSSVIHLNGGTVPYFWPYFGGISPYIGLINIGLIYGIGTSNKSVHEMASEAISKTHLVHGKDIHKFGKVPSLTTRLYNIMIYGKLGEYRLQETATFIIYIYNYI